MDCSIEMGVDCSRAPPKIWRDVVMMMMHQKAIDEFGLNAVLLLIPVLVWCI
jgi:hypothetical protein